mgnify:CR=1 FL=1
MTVVDLMTEIRAKSRANGAAEPWPEPEPFDAMDLPEFPVEALPPWLNAWACSESKFTQTPVDLSACVALGTVSLAVSRRFRVHVRWEEPTNLYIVVALKPGERKSAVFADGTRPLFEWMREEAERLAPKIDDRALERKVLAGKIETATTAAIKGKVYEGGDAMQAARELQAKFADLPELHAPRLVVDDCTTEALAMVMQENAERVGLISAEGGPFEIMAGRYSANGGGNFEIYLKAHPGDHHVVDRVRRPPIHLVRPLLTMVLTVQPSVIAGLASKDGFRGKGLLARFLYAMPTTALGMREVDPPAVPESAAFAYTTALDKLLRLGGDERALRMSPEADRARAAFQTELEPRLGPDGDLSPIADWANKLVGTVCRIAGVLHVGDWAGRLDKLPAEIPLETFQRGANIGVYFLAHAVAAFGAMGADEDTELAKRVWAWVQRKGIAEFSERDARRAVHAESKEIKPALAMLVERNLIRTQPPAPSNGGRPPGDSFDVNPRGRRT